MDTLMYTPKEYYPAICLALNYEAGGLEIHDYIYMEEMDVWYVDLTDLNICEHAFVLEGKFMRSCYKAYRKGVKSWIDAKAA